MQSCLCSLVYAAIVYAAFFYAAYQLCSSLVARETPVAELAWGLVVMKSKWPRQLDVAYHVVDKSQDVCKSLFGQIDINDTLESIDVIIEAVNYLDSVTRLPENMY